MGGLASAEAQTITDAVLPTAGVLAPSPYLCAATPLPNAAILLVNQYINCFSLFRSSGTSFGISYDAVTQTLRFSRHDKRHDYERTATLPTPLRPLPYLYYCEVSRQYG